jgi:translation initiation factor 4G
MQLSFRRATPDDVPFIVECLLASESSGTDVISYQRIFGLSEPELRTFFVQLAGEEVSGNEFSYVNYWIAHSYNTPIAGTAAWIEAADGMASNTIKTQLLSYFLGAERFLAAKSKLEKVAAIDIERAPGTLQLDSIAVRPSYRGQGVLQALIAHVLHHFKTHHPKVNEAQILLMAENVSARRAYEKSGFVVQQSTRSKDPEVPKLVPGTGRILMGRHY